MRVSVVKSLICAGLLGAIIYVLAAGGAASGQEYPLPPPPPPPVTLTKLKPFPVIRIKGFATTNGAQVTLLSVKAKVGVIIVSHCTGKKKSQCPYKRRVQQIKGTAGRTKTVHVNGFERGFRAGVELRIFAVSSDRIGKFTRYVIRSRRTPRRTDRCVRGVALTPLPCSKA
ncbi:MAG: hypothetical protein QOG15_3750 [Solirubrobacteraceae bacterium]|jgi:hypothetical protein|nr:hypothetical protein [Solirubrobacteraceae bacterium]